MRCFWAVCFYDFLLTMIFPFIFTTIVNVLSPMGLYLNKIGTFSKMGQNGPQFSLLMCKWKPSSVIFEDVRWKFYFLFLRWKIIDFLGKTIQIPLNPSNVTFVRFFLEMCPVNLILAWLAWLSSGDYLLGQLFFSLLSRKINC